MQPNPAWALQSDKLERFAYCANVFSRAECVKIIQTFTTDSLYKAQVNSNGRIEVDTDIRDSNITFFGPDAKTAWIYERLADVVKGINEKYFQFDLWGFSEHIQFAEYLEPGGNYSAHVDKIPQGTIRKLSIVVQLSDDLAYTGGDFEIIDGSLDNPTKLTRQQGTVLAFPSFTLHRVTPVTTGARYSLAGWITGPQFK